MRHIVIFTLIALTTKSVFAETIRDVTKNVVMRSPYQIQVCEDKAVNGDKTADTLKGAIIGGVIGNNVTKNVDNGAAVGALLGGIMGHATSSSNAVIQPVCNVETRYNEEIVQRYMYSVVTFIYEGREYNLQFTK